MARLEYEGDMRRHAVLGDFDKAKGRGLGAADQFIKGFSDPKAHPDFDPDSRDKLTAEMSRDLHALKVERQLAVTQLHAEANTAITLARSGYAVPQLDGMIERAQRLDPKLAASLSEGKGDVVYQADVAKLPPAQIMKDAQDWKAKADAATDLTEKARYARRHQAAVETLGETANRRGGGQAGPCPDRSRVRNPPPGAGTAVPTFRGNGLRPQPGASGIRPDGRFTWGACAVNSRIDRIAELREGGWSLERYSTEVVIGKFKGELTLLGSAGGTGQRGPQDEHDGYGNQRSRDNGHGTMLPNGRNAGGGGGGSNWEPPPDLDDEIPFAWPGDIVLGRQVPGL